MRALTMNPAPWIAAAVLAGSAAIAADEAPAPAAAGTPAVWKAQRIEFNYFGRTSRYTCDGIRDKLRALLVEVGARPDLTVTAVGCEPSGDLRHLNDFIPNVGLDFSAPALPDPEAKPLRAGDLAGVAAHYVPFRITTDAFRNMGYGDCELVDEFARQVLPRLATRNLQKDITCIPQQLIGSHYSIRGEILKALPPPHQS